MQRMITVALGVVIALAALASASAQPGGPPHHFYGTDGTPGDTIGVHANDDDLTLLDSAEVDAEGDWYVQVSREAADDVVFSINGEVAEGELTAAGEGQTQVSNLAVAEAMLDEGMEGDDDSMMDEDGDSMMDDEDSMMDEDEDSMMEDDDDSMMDDGETGYPATGTGGLASDGGVSAGLIGLLLALVTVSVAGLGLRRIRNRA